MAMIEESWFSGRGNKVSDLQVQTEIFYREKRQKVANLALFDLNTREYNEAAKEICCCPGEGWRNAGCIAHGLSTVIVHKSVAIKYLKHESWKEREVR
jgi:hypothetical protein